MPQAPCGDSPLNFLAVNAEVELGLAHRVQMWHDSRVMFKGAMYLKMAMCSEVSRLSAVRGRVVRVRESPPHNAVVKLGVTTTKPDIRCPWANWTDFATGSSVVIAPGRILTCAHCVTDACYIRVRKHNEDMLYHGTMQFADNGARPGVSVTWGARPYHRSLQNAVVVRRGVGDGSGKKYTSAVRASGSPRGRR